MHHFQQNILVYIPISFGMHHPPSSANGILDPWLDPCTFHNIADTFCCGAYHSLLPKEEFIPLSHTALTVPPRFSLQDRRLWQGGKKNFKNKISLSYEDSVTLSQGTANLLLKAQGERLNPVPPHFRNPRGQVSPTTPPFHRLTKPDLALLQALAADVARTLPPYRNDPGQICS